MHKGINCRNFNGSSTVQHASPNICVCLRVCRALKTQHFYKATQERKDPHNSQVKRSKYLKLLVLLVSEVADNSAQINRRIRIWTVREIIKNHLVLTLMLNDHLPKTQKEHHISEMPTLLHQAAHEDLENFPPCPCTCAPFNKCLQSQY